MKDIQSIGRTGLDAATARLEVSAGNVANALTPGYTPARVEPSAAAEGGVETRVARPAQDPAGSDAEVRADRALLAGSGTDLVAEAVSQLQAASLYRASLAAVTTGDALTDALLGIKP